jgi:hypothetical protein
MNVIDQLENVKGFIYPKTARDILEYLLNADNRLVVKFQYKNYGTFEVLDVHRYLEIPAHYDYVKQKNIEGYLENLFICESNHIEGHINRYYPNNTIVNKVLPFAVCSWGDRLHYIFFGEKNHFPILINTDSATFPPLQSQRTIENYISLNDIVLSKMIIEIKREDKIADLISLDRTYVTDGECIGNVNDYKEIIEETLKLSKGKFILTHFSSSETQDTKLIKLTINDNINGELILADNYDWINSIYISQLNKILDTHLEAYKFKEFRESNWGQEFGVLYATLDEIQDLEGAGFVT